MTITGVGPGYEIGNGTATITIDDDDTVTNPGDVLFRINAGGAEVSRRRWWPEPGPPIAERGHWSGPVQAMHHLLGGSRLEAADPTTIASNVNTILSDATASTPPARLTHCLPPSGSRTWRTPTSLAYAFNVENGYYTVNLYFDECSPAESTGRAGFRCGRSRGRRCWTISTVCRGAATPTTRRLQKSFDVTR